MTTVLDTAPAPIAALRESKVVGAGRLGARRVGGRCGRHRAQRGPAHAVQGAACVGVRPAVVLVGILPRAGRGDAPGRLSGRPLRPQEGPPRLLGALRDRIGGMCLFDIGGRVHGRPGARRPGRRRPDRHGVLRPDGAVHQGGAAEGGGDHVGGHLRGLPDRPHPRWLAADELLVGLGVPDQRARRRGGLGRRRRPGAGVPRLGAPRLGPRRGSGLGRRAGDLDLRPDQGRPGRLGQRRRSGS